MSKLTMLKPVMKIVVLSLAFILTSCVSASPTPTPTEIPPTETPAATVTLITGIDDVTQQTIEITVDSETEIYDYLLYLPEGYTGQEEWPLMLYLHGAGSRGSNISPVNGESIMNELGTLLHVPAIVVAPQAPANTIWDNQIPTLEAFLTAVTQQYPIDTNRIYLTGFSMGGFGTWAWGLENPDRFAALVPTAGGLFDYPSMPDNICDMKETAIWAFASSADTVVPGEKTTALTEALEACGSESVKLTLYDDASHGEAGARPYYSTSELYDWLWEQSLETE